MTYVSPVPPMEQTRTPRVGGYDRFGTPQDTVTGRVTSHQGAPVPPPPRATHLPRRRSMLLAVTLAAFFGPLGMLYSAPLGALVMMLLTLMLAVPLSLMHAAPLALFFVAPICMAWAFFATAAHNGAVSLARRLTMPAPSPRRW